ncbi:MAG: flagellar biosynthetic protein FliR [Phycisphaerales bacterium]
MDFPELALRYAEPFVLMLARFGGLCAFAPVLSTSVIPAKAKALLVAMFAVGALPMVALTPPLHPAPDLALLAVGMALEALIGVTIGLLATLPLYAAQLAGHVIDHQMGIGLAASYNPLLETEGGVTGDLLMYIALAAFLTVGGLDAMYLGVLLSFEIVPLGNLDALASPLPLLISLVTAGFELALRLAAPVLCMIIVELVSSAFVMKTMPQINIMSIGFPIKIIIGLIAMVISVRAMGGAITSFTADGIDATLHWVESLDRPTHAATTQTP